MPSNSDSALHQETKRIHSKVLNVFVSINSARGLSSPPLVQRHQNTCKSLYLVIALKRGTKFFLDAVQINYSCIVIGTSVMILVNFN